MKPVICVISNNDRGLSIGFASATRTFVIVAILAIAAALYWSAGVAALAQSTRNDLTVLQTDLTGETITVTTCNDVADFSGAQQVSDLPGPDGRVSFREATIAANNTPGGQTIAFAIPVADFWWWTDGALLKSEQGAFFIRDSETTVDFTTQTTNIGDTNPTGLEVMIYNLSPNWNGIPAIFVTSNNCLIKGLSSTYQAGYGVRLTGNNNRVIGADKGSVIIEGYSGDPAPSGNIVGGTAPGEGNNLTGVRIGGPAENNIVIGNTIIGGVDVIGSTQYGVIARNNRIGGPTSAERNIISGSGYYSSEGYPVGEQVSVVDADGTIIEGNYIGTTVDGMARYPQQVGAIGVEVRDSRGTTVRGNLIAGLRSVGTSHYNGQIFGQAVYVNAANRSSYDTLVEDNTIGLAADGVTTIVTRSGITVSPMSSVLHAFGTRITSNHIGGVETTGIVIGSNENGITLSGNSIHDSGLLGIDLFYNFNGIGGVTLNDAGDGDVGGNGLQNFPVLQSAVTTGAAVTIQGTLDTSPSVGQFAVEFFSSPSCDPTGFGEGARFLGSTTVTTDGAGHGTFSATLPIIGAAGMQATATATRLSTGDTSEFSSCVAISSGSTQTPAVTPTNTPTSTPTATPSAGISGTVTYGNAIGAPTLRSVSNVLISGAGATSVSTSTGFPGGTYSLSGFGTGSYTVTASKTGGANNITSFDAARIAQHAAGINFLSGTQLIVADVSENGTVSSFDAGQVARWAVSVPGSGWTGTWVFSPASRSYPSVTTDITGEDYTGLLMGEVSGNWVDSGARSDLRGGGGPERTTAIQAPHLVTPADNEVIIPVSVQGAANRGIISYEFDLRYDPSVIQPHPDPVDLVGTVSSRLSSAINAEEAGLLRVAVYGPMPLDNNGVLLNLRFTAVGAPGSVSPIMCERIMFNEGDPGALATDGQVELSAAAPNQAEIGGRLLNSIGQGIPNARVTFTDTAGRKRAILSNGFGVYRFGGLQVGQTYTMSVESRGWTFTPLTISTTDDLISVDMIAEQ